ncbi:putative homeobox and C2H2 transcription factor [Aspergillus lucknowensis]|uniref:Homeobox and C2H2 transcription factor n=1 Tax=Aspergillus lucknowensis TaxID=176173 RepID=A0ABR4M5M8_9EURO
MEFFDFDEAASGSFVRDDDVASDNLEIDENDAMANYQSLLHDQSLGLPTPVLEQDVCEGAMVDTPDPEGVYPMFRAKDPCDFCRNMGLDCFIAKRGVMQKSGCTCCISLYRECSFTHSKPAGKFLDTLHPISENIDIPTGGLTGKKALKSLSGIGEDVDARARKSSSRLSREAVRILKTWLNGHSDHPYPTEEEKEQLELRTGLRRTQITNWLANARRRGKVRPSPRSSSPVPGAVDIPKQPHIDHTLMTPLERWKYSPPENEPAAISNILRALEDTSLDVRHGSQSGHVRSHSRRTGSSNDSSHANSNVFDASSLVSSHETSRSASRSSVSDLSFASAFSHRSSHRSFGSMERKERRRRRKPSTPANTFTQQKAKSARIYQCTFCADSFQTKYDWQRHEKSLHLALEKWTCAPHGGVAFINGANRCVFCMAIDPDHDHLETHNYSNCAEKTEAERTFYRKDHLNQHLRLMHNVRFDPSMDQWRSHTTQIISRCGFCGITLTTWKGRADHLATHFKNGADMAQWQGDWGFEPVVESLVENAMPPYLIGQERHTLDPFKLSERMPGPGLRIPEDANCFERLRRELVVFIRENMANGVVPTDQMIQDQGRRIIYGSDDPWNQTCCDNPTWLDLLKREAGLKPATGSEHNQFANLDMQPPYARHEGQSRPPPRIRQSFMGSGYPSPGFQSPAIPGTGRSSVAASVPGSSAGSYVGSAGQFPGARHSGLSLDFGSSVSAGVSPFSTPLSTSVDPFVQMGFDPEFLKQLNDHYEEQLPVEGLQGLSFGFDDSGGDFAVHNAADPMDMTGMVTSAATAPIPIPSSKQPDVPMPDAVCRPDLRFQGTDGA